MIVTYLILFVLSAIFLMISATLIIRSLIKISHFLRISEFTAAFIIMALATSSPELFVGISSALSGNPSLSLGNVLGASIIDLTLLVGLFTLISGGIKIKTGKLGKELHHVIVLIILLFILFIIGNSLSRIDGIILLCFFAFNSYRLFKKRKRFPKKLKSEKLNRHKIFFTILIFVISVILLFIAANLAVKYATLIAKEMNIPQILAGIFLLSIATTLPELVFGLRVVNMHHSIMALGDLTGAVVTNLTLVLGIVSIITPIKSEVFPFIFSMIILLFSAFIFIRFIRNDQELKTKEGIIMLLIYVVMLSVEVFLK